MSTRLYVGNLPRGANEAISRVVPMPPWWPSRANRRQQAAMHTLDDVILQIIASRRTHSAVAAGTPAASSDDLLSMLMEARDEETGEGMSDAQLRDEVMTIFLAGHETTANALTWSWYLLSKRPDLADRLATEARANGGVEGPTLAQIGNLEFAGRVNPTAPRSPLDLGRDQLIVSHEPETQTSHGLA